MVGAPAGDKGRGTGAEFGTGHGVGAELGTAAGGAGAEFEAWYRDRIWTRGLHTILDYALRTGLPC